MPYDVDIGDGADALGQNQLTDALDGTYWVSGWDATLGTGDLEVDIAAGSGAVDGADVSTGSTQTIDFTGDPDSTDPRKAVIYVDSGGTVQKALGTPQPVDPSGEIRFRTYNPSPPASVSGVVVAEVWLAAGETALESADVRDRRVSNDAVEGFGNVPDWSEDDTTPVNTSTNSVTLTLANTYDRVDVHFVVSNIPSGPSDIYMRLNGVSTRDYLIYDITGSSFDFSEFPITPISEGDVVSGRIEITGVWGTDTTEACMVDYSVPRQAALENTFEKGYLTATSPLDEIELFTSGGETVDWSINVFGRNIG